MPAVRRQLQLSDLHVTQQELLGENVDIESLKLIIQSAIDPTYKAKEIGDRMLSANITRTIEGASTLSISLIDQDRELWQSGNFGEKLDIRVDGLWFRLADVSKSGGVIDLVFEDREIGILRSYDSFIAPISRQQITRAEFILRLLQEVKEITIPYVIPELHIKQPVFNKNQVLLSPVDRAPGINVDEKLTVKGNSADPIQITNADIILRTGDSMIDDSHPRKRKILVCSIMTAIVESVLFNTPTGDLDSQGLFQQRPSMGYKDVTDPVSASRQFFVRAVAYDADHPHISYNDLCQGVQHSGHPDEYGHRRTEAEHFVDAFGRPGGDSLTSQASLNAQNNYQTALGNYHFYRGVPPSRKNGKWKTEDSWTCIQRLAQEVNWVAFFVSGTFYYLSEDDLFKSKARAILSESSDGVDSIDGNLDPNKKVAEITIPCRMGRWEIPPGSIVKLVDSGPFNGRWLATTVERDIFDPLGTITLKKPNPRFMEPNSDSLGNAYSGANTIPKSTDPKASPPYPGFEWTDSSFLASKILTAFNNGTYKDDNGRQITQWRKVAGGQPLHSQCGFDSDIDSRIAQKVVYLLENGWEVGTYAIMEDHSCCVAGTGAYPHCRVSAHASGRAIDISSIGKVGVGWKSLTQKDNITKQWVLDVMMFLRNLNPEQIICNGIGNQTDIDIQGHQWNNGQQVNYITSGHTTHIHVGFST